MSRQKEKKIKKLHKKYIWPAVLVTFLFIIAFIILLFVMFGLFFERLITDRMEGTMENVQRVSQILKEEQITGEEELKDLLKEIQRTLPEVKEICILDENHEIKMKTGQDAPKVGNVLYYAGVETVAIYLSENSDDILFAQDGEIKINWERIVNQMSELNGEDPYTDSIIFHCNIWSGDVENQNEWSVFTKNEIVIKESELGVMIIFALAAFFLAVCFAVYYIVFIVGLVRDQRRLTSLLYFEPETGGKNWNYLKTKGKKLIAKGFRNKENYALVQIRMKKFQSFCVCYGAKEGLELLELLYWELQKNLTKKEIGVHYARADFVVLMKYKEKEELEERLEQILSKLGAVRQGQRLCFGVGVYEIKDNKTDLDAMYNNANTACSALESEGEKWLKWYSEEMYQQQLWERKVEDTMEKALERKEFKVYLQPKYSSREEKLSGAEALVRWVSPEEGFIAPNRFIPIFENNGFILKLDDYMISEVARQQAEWIEQGKTVVPISVNVSRAHFTKEDLAEHICSLVDRYQVPHEVIELELTESAFFQDKEVLLHTVQKLREYGFAVSMDDFGAGYSSLNSLKELPLDVIKLDAEFFREIEDMGKGKIIVNEAICLAKKLDMKIVAEGIETKEQVDFLAELGCDLIQGYYFAKPMPVSEFEEKAF